MAGDFYGVAGTPAAGRGWGCVKVYLEKLSMMIRKYLAPNVDGQGAGPQRSRCSNSRGQEACKFDKEKES